LVLCVGSGIYLILLCSSTGWRALSYILLAPSASLARQVVSARLVMTPIHHAAGMLAVCWFCASVREFI
jgi:hypothetical protein